MNFRRNTKRCAYCEKDFIISGVCSNYMYKFRQNYYCCYNHWRAAKREHNEKIAAAEKALEDIKTEQETKEARYAQLREQLNEQTREMQAIEIKKATQETN